MKTKPKPIVKYLHTIDGKPGQYDGQQISFARALKPVRLAESLEQIHEEQKLTRQWRVKKFGKDSLYLTYDWVRVQI